MTNSKKKPRNTKYDKVQKQLQEILKAEGYYGGGLLNDLPIRTAMEQMNWETHVRLVVQKAQELEMNVPQQLIDDLNNDGLKYEETDVPNFELARQLIVAAKLKTKRRRARVSNALKKIISDGGYHGLLKPDPIACEKTLAKQRNVVIKALAIGEHVPKLLLKHLGLEDEPNPPTNFEDDGKAPF